MDIFFIVLMFLKINIGERGAYIICVGGFDTAHAAAR